MKKGRITRFHLVLVLIGLMLLVSLVTVGAATSGPFAGKNITVAVFGAGVKGPVSGPLYHWRAEWEKMTGAKLNIVEIPLPQLHEKIFTDLITGTGRFDGIIGWSQYMGEYIAGNYIVPIDKYMKNPKFPKWDPSEVVNAHREILQWNGKYYSPPYDQNTHIMYYRRDILGNPAYQQEFKKKYGYNLPVPPKTWDQYIDVAEFFNGWDWNKDGQKDYGVTMPLKRGWEGWNWYMMMAASYSIFPGPEVDRYHNVFHFDPETMEPLVNEPGHVRALEKMVRLAKCGPEAMTSWGLAESWDVFLKGNAALMTCWGDVTPLAQETSIKGQVGAAALPGSKEVWDRENGKWVTVPEVNLVGNTTGQWNGVISKYSKNPEVVYHLLAFLASKEVAWWNITHGWTGINPGYNWSFLPPYGTGSLKDFEEAGWDSNDAKYYSNAHAETYKRKTFLSYLRIPGVDRYYDLLDLRISEAIGGISTPQKALDALRDDWQRATRDIGLTSQKIFYRQSIGYEKK